MGNNQTSKATRLIPEHDEIHQKKKFSFSRVIEHLSEKDEDFEMNSKEYEKMKNISRQVSSTTILRPPFCFVY
ncbi:unnamed protein product [Adineta ricciae]|uniref:Uncharacterized protein n=1 Tax=Adineta ricciae TaxID=249248 RepID=A0A815C0R0_ADIRI|nr:unnamed protein product [Adineta ricciae]CAF1608335.1 unnamed protein product [Adineta ricciae]